ncbi:hypothetical protein Sjap_020626 [Stephania japonica]|uniref:Uncharacterized protein n=1 Tax=Stephania japonica TaxID=461633 RepID=A0AAP0F3T6_9MAGN
MQPKMSNDDKNHRVRDQQWTDERHAKYLTQMEASFVQKLSVLTHQSHLHRQIPDCSESTRDSRHPRSKRSNPGSCSTNGTTTGPLFVHYACTYRICTSNHEKAHDLRHNVEVDRTMGPLHATTVKPRRRSAQPSTDSSQDQVVPDIGNSKSGN